MFESYAESVLYCANDQGLLSVDDAKKLLDEHDTSLYQIEQDGYTANCCDAAALLDHLGY